jgi:hypothetical protein
MAPVLAHAPKEVIDALARSLSGWLWALASIFTTHQDLFFVLCQRVLDASQPDDLLTDHLVDRAINHPVGQITKALLSWWYRRELADDEGLPVELESIFTRLCDTQVLIYRHARVLLAARIISLFRVDPEWAKKNLLPHFNWKASNAEAKASWQGFLWSPRLYPPLLELIKSNFLSTARHYKELSTEGRQYAALLTFIALESRDAFTTSDLRAAIEALPEVGRQAAVRTLTRALEGSGEQRAEYWRNRILPYWKVVWPKARVYRTEALTEPLAKLCIAAGEVFPEAVEEFRPWMQTLRSSDLVVLRFDQEKLCSRYPAAALEFLNLLVDTKATWPPLKLGECLKDIKAADPLLEEDGRFRRLTEFLRRRE